MGLGFPYEGPAPLEAIANGCVFLQPKFNPARSSLNHEFFRGKPTSREVCEAPQDSLSVPLLLGSGKILIWRLFHAFGFKGAVLD